MRTGRRFIALATLVTLAVGAAAFGAGTASSASTSRASANAKVIPSTTGTIAFRRYTDASHSTGAVFTIGAGGTGEKQITSPPTGVLDDQPAWAPDGSSIAFTRCTSTGPCQIYVVNPDGTGLAALSSPCETGADAPQCPDDVAASFSPDGEQLAFVQSTGNVKHGSDGEDYIEHSALALFNRDGTGRHVIYTHGSYTGDIAYPSFAPDGKHIVFERRNSSFTRPANRTALFVIGVDGSNPHQITPWANSDGDGPDWSPTGKWIVFRSHVDDPDRQSQVFRIRPNGSGRTQLTHFARGTQVASSTFSPDGTSIVLSKGPADGNLAVYSLSLRGGPLKRITHSSYWDSAPDWGPR
jgi:TolB protein